MNCHDIRNAIYVYLDGEFAGPEELAFQRHVDGCADCRDLLQRESEFLVAFKAQLETPKAPAELRKRIEEKLHETPRAPRQERSSGSSSWRFALPLAAAAGLAAVLVMTIDTAGAEARPVVEEAIAAHQSDLPMEARGSNEQVREFLQAHVPFAVQIPFDDVQGIQLVGARLTRYNGRQAVLFNFDAGGERVSVLQVASPPDADGDDEVHEDRQGYRVVTFRHKGLTNSVVGNVAPAKIDQMRSRLRPSIRRASFQR